MDFKKHLEGMKDDFNQISKAQGKVKIFWYVGYAAWLVSLYLLYKLWSMNYWMMNWTWLFTLIRWTAIVSFIASIFFTRYSYLSVIAFVRYKKEARHLIHIALLYWIVIAGGLYYLKNFNVITDFFFPVFVIAVISWYISLDYWSEFNK